MPKPTIGAYPEMKPVKKNIERIKGQLNKISRAKINLTKKQMERIAKALGYNEATHAFDNVSKMMEDWTLQLKEKK